MFSAYLFFGTPRESKQNYAISAQVRESRLMPFRAERPGGEFEGRCQSRAAGWSSDAMKTAQPKRGPKQWYRKDNPEELLSIGRPDYRFKQSQQNGSESNSRYGRCPAKHSWSPSG
jgi:hypothetical protein